MGTVRKIPSSQAPETAPSPRVPAAAPSLPPKRRSWRWEEPTLLTVAATGLISAGILHFMLGPAHLTEARGQGIFFLVLASAQVGTGLGLMRQPSARVAMMATLLAASPIVVYALGRVVAPPFSSAPEGVDIVGLATQAAELSSLAALLLWWRSSQVSPLPRWSPRRGVAALLVASLVLGLGAHGAGVAAESAIPWLAEPEAGGHEESVPAPSGPSGMDPAGAPGEHGSGHGT